MGYVEEKAFNTVLYIVEFLFIIFLNYRIYSIFKHSGDFTIYLY